MTSKVTATALDKTLPSQNWKWPLQSWFTILNWLLISQRMLLVFQYLCNNTKTFKPVLHMFEVHCTRKRNLRWPIIFNGLLDKCVFIINYNNYVFCSVNIDTRYNSTSQSHFAAGKRLERYTTCSNVKFNKSSDFFFIL